jgi:N-dimethylarginine dimethylaminohydrolase
MPPRFLMTDVAHFGVNYQINPWMRPDAWRADENRLKAAAAKSADELRKALEQLGAKVDTLPAIAGLPDMVFPANAAIVLDGRVLVARFRHPERQGEEKFFRSAFLDMKARGLVQDVFELPDGVLQEGAGDAIWDQDRAHFWAGFGPRSSANSLPVLADTFGHPIVGLELATDRFYHLDTCFCPLTGGRLLYYPPAFASEARAIIESHVRPQDRIEASDEDAAAFCVNAVNVGRHIVMAKAPARLKRRLEGLGYTVSDVDLSPFILAGGGAYCMTLRLDRTSGRQVSLRAAE